MTVLIILVTVLYFISSIAISVLSSIMLDRVNIHDPLVVFLISVLWILIIPGTAIYYVTSKNGERDLEELFNFLGI